MWQSCIECHGVQVDALVIARHMQVIAHSYISTVLGSVNTHKLGMQVVAIQVCKQPPAQPVSDDRYPIILPVIEAHNIALRTTQILNHLRHLPFILRPHHIR